MSEWPKDLRFSTVEEVTRFDSDLRAFEASKAAGAFQWIDISQVWLRFQPHPEGGRIFAMCLDLRLTVACLQCDLGRIGPLVNAHSQGTADDPLDSFELYQLNTGYILRYRTIFEKIMALVVLTGAPKRYSDLLKSKKRSSTFRKIVTQSPNIPDALGEYIRKTTIAFDARYRTPEAHNTGSVRKWSFQAMGSPENAQADMFWAWNSLRPLLTDLGEILGGAPPAA